MNTKQIHMNSSNVNSFIKKRVRQLLLHSLVGQVISAYYKGSIPNYGCIINTNHQAIIPSTIARIYWGTYERAEINFVRKYLRTDVDVIELGSSIGIVSAHIAQKLVPAKKLICVEANPELLSTISINVKKNAPNIEMQILQGAIDYSGQKFVTLSLGERNTDSKVTKSGDFLLDVPTLTLNHICTQYHVHDFCLICDIEGSEWGIIQNEGILLNQCRQVIIELHDFRQRHRLITVSDMISAMVNQHRFILSKRHGNVCLFER